MKWFCGGLLTRILSTLLICSMMSVSFASGASARFISPDTWDPTQEGVGTNRYAYAGNDPVNKSDPNGHIVPVAVGIAIGIGALFSFFSGTTEANAPGANDKIYHTSDGQVALSMIGGASGGTLVGKAAGKAVDVAAEELFGSADNKKQIASAEQIKTPKVSFSRQLTAKDLGVKGDITQLRGSITVKDGVATVRVDIIEGRIRNPLGVVKNLSDVARSSGATSLRVEGSLANPKLFDVLKGRYNLISEGPNDYFTLDLR